MSTEKVVAHPDNTDVETAYRHERKASLARTISPTLDLRGRVVGVNPDTEDDDVHTSSDVFSQLAAKEKDHDIKFRTLSWQQAALLLFAEYVCLAILALPWSYSVLGWGTGLTVHIVTGAITWYTSYVLWQWCMKHPETRDICDIAAKLFPFCPRFAYEATSVMLLLNNIFIIGFHIFTGARIFNTLTDDKWCTVGWQGVSTIIGIVVSLPRTLKHVSAMSVFSAGAWLIGILLALIYLGIQAHPSVGYGGPWPELGPVTTYAGFPNPDLTFVNGFNAVMNITFLWIGQVLYPSFIAEMRDPRDFPKALAALTGLESVLFLVVAVVGYYYLGQYAEAPLIGSLEKPWMRKSSFAFALIPTFIIGTIYSNVSAKYVFQRLLGGSKHAHHQHSNTWFGWGVWTLITVAVWLIGFILGNVIPSMGDFLSIMAAAFDSFFGFIFWAMAYYYLNKGKLFKGPLNIFLTLLNVVIFGFGLFMLGPGLYTSIEAIILDYAGPVRGAFSCASNGL